MIAYDFIKDGFKFVKSTWGDLLLINPENYVSCAVNMGELKILQDFAFIGGEK
jgi:hypothetical protein